jgi:hypothetical protein
VAGSTSVKQITHELRIKFGIPDNGFVSKTEMLKWSEELFTKKEGWTKWSQEINALMLYTDSAFRWRRAFECHVLHGSLIGAHLIPPGCEIAMITEGPFVPPYYVAILTYRDTSIEDIESAWPRIKLAQEGTIDMRRPQDDGTRLVSLEPSNTMRVPTYSDPISTTPKNIDDYLAVHELKVMGKTYKEIAKEVFGSENEYPRVGTYLSRYRKMLNKAGLF